MQKTPLQPDASQSALFSSVAVAFWLQLREVIVIVLSTVATFIAIDGAGINAVVASATVGLLGSLLPAFGALERTRLHGNIYIGSFAGMCSGSIVIGLHEIVSVGLVTGIVMMISRRWFVGFGGKMGSIAFVGSVVFLWSGGAMQGSLPETEQPLLLLCVLAAAALFTFELWQRLPAFKNHQVRASAIVTLALCLLWFLVSVLWQSLPLLMSFEQMAALCFCGSFIGMSTHHQVRRITVIIAVFVLAGIYPSFSHYLGLFGGALGFMAFVSLLLTFTAYKLVSERLKDWSD